MEDREAILLFAKVAQKAKIYDEELGVLGYLLPLVKSVGCFGLSWEERYLLEEAMKHEVNKVRNTIDIVVNCQN
jgi:hypothetical protein